MQTPTAPIASYACIRSISAQEAWTLHSGVAAVVIWSAIAPNDPCEEKMPRLIAELQAQFVESAKLEAAIKRNLKGLGYAR